MKSLRTHFLQNTSEWLPLIQIKTEIIAESSSTQDAAPQHLIVARLKSFWNLLELFAFGKEVVDNGFPRNLYNGSHPCLTSEISRRSWGTDNFTSSTHSLWYYTPLPCRPVKFLKTLFLTEHLRWLLLSLSESTHFSGSRTVSIREESHGFLIYQVKWVSILATYLSLKVH